ncbi:hypothetical protein SGCOL_007747 [Colletotrichum sp. CLE4]
MISTLSLIVGILAAAPWSITAQEYPIIGVRSGINMRTGEMPIRRNINNIYGEAGPQWDLYVGALAAMQDANETDSTSFFQEFMDSHTWPGREEDHRPERTLDIARTTKDCLALGIADISRFTRFQVLVRYAKRIAMSYPEPHKRAYVEAADSLRAAYWDWAADSQVPPMTALPTLVTKKPVDGALQSVAVRNPFYRYNYPKTALDGSFGSFDGQNYTKRCVENGESYPDTANAKLTGYNLKEKVYNVFVKATSFDEMVTAQNEGPNFEGPHGEVHVGAACGQDLLHLSTSAFEPLL